MTIKEILKTAPLASEVQVLGWVKTKRVGKRVIFLAVQDGSTQEDLQIVFGADQFAESLLKEVATGASIRVRGKLVASPGRGQGKEVEAQSLELVGATAERYPLQPKPHSLAFLRSIQHLRFRTNTFGAVFRLRHALAQAVHEFFHKRGFFWLHTPIITSVDAEGAGEVFEVKRKGGAEEDFFGRPVFLTVSGQLAAEAAMMGLGRVYTFGPTFRAENSNTTRHLAEFWMVEPEVAFCDLEGAINLAEAFITHLVSHALTQCPAELDFLEKRVRSVSPGASLSLRERLEGLLERPFVRLSYTEAVLLLQKAQQKASERFVYPVEGWGADLQTEHERYLAAYCKGGVVVTDYPKDLKAFYMRQNSDGRTVAAMDLLLPGIGEVVGGSQREERHAPLQAAMERVGISVGEMQWYLETRCFGSVPHSGFGLGFERLMAFITGMENVRDVIPFPRTPGQAMC